MLNIRKALMLYNMVGEFLPDDIPDDGLEFVHQIIKNIRSSHNESVYVDVLMILVNEDDLSNISQLNAEDALNIFIDGLVESQIIKLREFCRTLGYGRRSTQKSSS